MSHLFAAAVGFALAALASLLPGLLLRLWGRFSAPLTPSDIDDLKQRIS